MNEYLRFKLDSFNIKFPYPSKTEPSIIINEDNVLEILLDAIPDMPFFITLQDNGTTSTIPFAPPQIKDSFYIPPFFKGFYLQLQIDPKASPISGRLKTRISFSQSEIPSKRFSIPL